MTHGTFNGKLRGDPSDKNHYLSSKTRFTKATLKTHAFYDYHGKPSVGTHRLSPPFSAISCLRGLSSSSSKGFKLFDAIAADTSRTSHSPTFLHSSIATHFFHIIIFLTILRLACFC